MVIAEYTLTFSVLARIAIVLKAVLGVLGISEKMGEAAAKRMPLWLCILLRVEVLRGGEVFKGGMVWV